MVPKPLERHVVMLIDAPKATMSNNCNDNGGFTPSWPEGSTYMFSGLNGIDMTLSGESFFP
jgi:hypothetical protein